MKSKRLSRSPALGTLLALLLGIGLGLLVFRSQSTFWLRVTEGVSTLGTLWTNALRMTIIPLVVSTLIVAVAGEGGSRSVGKISGLAFATFIGLLATGSILVLLTLPPILSRLNLERPAAETKNLESGQASKQPDGTASLIDVIATLLPSNLIKAAADDDLLPLVIFSILVGLAATRIDPDQREILISVLRALSNSVRIIIGWILWILPVGIFAFSFAASASLGWSTVGLLGSWIVIASVLAATLTIGLYFIALIVGRVNLRSFAKAILPAQGVAIATRSSLAALPALLEGAQRHLRCNQAVANVVLPISVSSFKLNRSINSTARLLFLAYVYGVNLTPAAIAAFIVAAMLVSFTSPGLPARGPVVSLPLYLAAGIPLEGIVMLRSVDSITDFAMTVLNVTGDMTAMTIVARFSPNANRTDATDEMRAEDLSA